MGKLPIKNGTPVGSVSLCKTCSYAQIMTGFRESELITICHNPSPTLFVPFNVYECTRYYDKNRPSWSQMKKLAIDVVPGTLKPVGFKVGAGFVQTTTVQVGGDDEDDDDFDD
jgi:hypothetical protein